MEASELARQVDRSASIARSRHGSLDYADRLGILIGQVGAARLFRALLRANMGTLAGGRKWTRASEFTFVLHRGKDENSVVRERDSNLELAERQAEERTNELIREFHEHYQEYVRLHPEDRERKDDIFQAWAIQKIAGLQLCVEHIAEQLNTHMAGGEEVPF